SLHYALPISWMSLLKVPGVRLMVIASASLPACCLILLISAWETVLSTVTTTRLVLLSTAQAVPGTSAFSTELLTLLSSAELKVVRSEEHTSELQSREKLVCRLL